MRDITRTTALLVLALAAVSAACSPTPGPSVAPGSPSASAPAPSPVASGVTPSPPVPTATASSGAGLAEVVAAARARLVTDADLVGQLLLVGWAGSSAAAARPAITELRPGGVVFITNAELSDEATAINLGLVGTAAEAGILPLLKAIDHEGGAVQRISDVENLGSNRDFGAGRPTDLEACRRGAEHAIQLREMGFDMNLAPVLDVDTNAANPVIGPRSYGADPRLVARLGAGYIRGLQSGGVAAVAKHFPGHGDTSVDSHLGLPVLDFSRRRLDRVELVPFVRAIDPATDVAAVMTAHIALPRLDPDGVPATLSRAVITGILRGDLGFDGLVLSDDLAAMQAITDTYEPGEAAVRAVAAGVDLLIVGGDLERQRTSRDALLDALATGALARERVEEAVDHVLTIKARFGLLDAAAVPPPEAC
jgi:beta-N-acetylhexosaminidase